MSATTKKWLSRVGYGFLVFVFIYLVVALILGLTMSSGGAS
jgi:hypothetical protein